MNWSYVLYLSTLPESEIINEVKSNVDRYYKGDKQQEVDEILREGYEAFLIARYSKNKGEEKNDSN